MNRRALFISMCIAAVVFGRASDDHKEIQADSGDWDSDQSTPITISDEVFGFPGQSVPAVAAIKFTIPDVTNNTGADVTAQISMASSTVDASNPANPNSSLQKLVDPVLITGCFITVSKNQTTAAPVTQTCAISADDATRLFSKHIINTTLTSQNIRLGLGAAAKKLSFAGTNTVNLTIYPVNLLNPTFAPAKTYAAPTGSRPRSVVLADFNGDGKLDIAIGNFTSPNVTILLGNGDGTFGAPKMYAAAANAVYTIAAADFNGDGKLDLAVGNSGSFNVSILLGKGDGTFQTPLSVITGGSALALAVDDFNGDRRADIAVSNGTQTTVTVLFGKGDGTFQAPVDLPTNGVGSIAVADLNKDGRPDIVTSGGVVSVILNNGNGTFKPSVDVFTNGSPTTVAASDLNRDGAADLIVSMFGYSEAMVNNGAATFSAPAIIGSPGLAYAIADFNLDGRRDVAIASSPASVAAGDGFGGFNDPVRLSPNAAGVAAADLNGDGWPDIVFVDPDANTISVLINSTATAIPQPVTVTSNPPGLTITTDVTNNCTTPCNFQWTSGTTHTLGAAGAWVVDSGTHLVFTGWDDGGAGSHQITVPPGGATYTASYKTQYQLNLSANPSAGGTVTPASGAFYDAGTMVNVTAFPTPPATFVSWTGGVASPSSAATTVTMDAPKNLVAQFSGGPPPGGLRFVPVTPCRVADTRNVRGTFGGPSIAAGTTRAFPITSSSCGIPASAKAFSLNVTVVPSGALGYLTIWPSDQPQPLASTLNSLDGRIKANAAIVPAGADGAVKVFATNTTDVVLDINGYFTAEAGVGLQFYPVTPCRVSDTRGSTGSLGGPTMSGGQTRTIPVPSSTCNIPSTAQAYSLNFTVVPIGPLGYLSTWPAGSQQPLVSTLNALTGAITANAAIVPAGTGGAINVYTTNRSDVVIDINGYFAPPATGGLSFYTLAPCRISDTRFGTGPFGGPSLAGGQARTYPVPSSGCSVPAAAKAYSLNATVVPAPSGLGYLTLWPSDAGQPFVSTLNALDGSITANAAIVPAAANGSISAYATHPTDLVLDINGYFAP